MNFIRNENSNKRSRTTTTEEVNSMEQYPQNDLNFMTSLHQIVQTRSVSSLNLANDATYLGILGKIIQKDVRKHRIVISLRDSVVLSEEAKLEKKNTDALIVLMAYALPKTYINVVIGAISFHAGEKLLVTDVLATNVAFSSKRLHGNYLKPAIGRITNDKTVLNISNDPTVFSLENKPSLIVSYLNKYLSSGQMGGHIDNNIHISFAVETVSYTPFESILNEIVQLFEKNRFQMKDPRFPSVASITVQFHLNPAKNYPLFDPEYSETDGGMKTMPYTIDQFDYYRYITTILKNKTINAVPDYIIDLSKTYNGRKVVKCVTNPKSVDYLNSGEIFIGWTHTQNSHESERTFNGDPVFEISLNTK